MGTVNTNDEPDKIEANKINKAAHIKHGNILSEYKIAQINTGNGHWAKNDFILLSTITRLDPDIIIISESNFNPNDPETTGRRENLFRDFKCFDKIFQNSNFARISVLVKNTHTVERIQHLENEINSTIILKLKMKNRKF